ncbi:MAG: 16S rRNA (guanine(966)-N(2))-methyltransferase RsmD [Ignavibacteria bacterium RIFOXYB2_FULL_35_12]|nr:MAG: 16S rRNA (guanine(966)-N(2))-methyltransferase RsmD [Ignavibacteria bacterium GWA2_36_19]OGU54289.1 MAG: 16S rRNA (guanine(966)-N(2))-methyltransferase RsmD [Ignavibacteria bacterium GWC2_35_8]OGU61702.1 MAG: 16S rRNA (guanine(966)-N(2))-methyltransferase RsmD [Ignavibacteria bacterium GWF2_35_20]OGU78581.1 MAG: 16S rRNA (guanine(966)-N(2))-methyltransferase RsmD [Ignavibacteria bacterium RIFOXYA2_FULL_35_9]OGU81587.1 MAG: 16S rRNA (guanine(966)-N(2))-methyltransferase RsmD [Ignavibacte
MRIISGKFKGRTITSLNSKFIRPMTDRVRVNLFDILTNKIDFNGIKVLDIYSGSGSLGLECLSRGADEVHFVERNFIIYKNLLKNIKSLDVEDQCKIFKMEALKFSRMEEHERYDLIFADPPFFKDDIYEVVDNLRTNTFLSEDGRIIIQRSIQTKEKDKLHFEIKPFKIIGDSCLYSLDK